MRAGREAAGHIASPQKSFRTRVQLPRFSRIVGTLPYATNTEGVVVYER